VSQLVDPRTLDDLELRNAIQANSEAMAAVDRERAVIAGGHGGAADAKVRQKLADELEQRWEQLRREYEVLRAEHRQRRADRGQP
jgi:hypothetical protein